MNDQNFKYLEDGREAPSKASTYIYEQRDK